MLHTEKLQLRFNLDPPGSKQATFVPESNPSNKIPGFFNNNPANFKPTDPDQLQPRQDTRGTLTPKEPPGSPPMSGTLVPGPGPQDPWPWVRYAIIFAHEMCKKLLFLMLLYVLIIESRSSNDILSGL
jgi:hypothetical protein